MVSLQTGHSKSSLMYSSGIEFWFVLEVAILSFDSFVVYLFHLWAQIVLTFGNKLCSEIFQCQMTGRFTDSCLLIAKCKQTKFRNGLLVIAHMTSHLKVATPLLV